MKIITKSFCLAGILWLLSSNLIQAQCQSAFTYSLGANGVVTLTSTSTGTTSATWMMWSFGPNNTAFTATGTAGMYATHGFSVNGTYTVALTIIDPFTSCSSSSQQTLTITSSAANCTVNAFFSIAGTATSTAVHLLSSSSVSNTLNYYWNFGDGNTATGFGPVHTYTTSGTHNVYLTATSNSTPGCARSSVNAINITTCMINNPVIISYSLGPNGQVNFFSTTTSTGSPTYMWYIYYASANYTSTLANPTFTLPNGPFFITMTMIVGSCTVSAANVTGTVTNNSNCNLLAGFSAVQQNSIGLGWTFNNNSTGTLTTSSYSWDFGDQTTSSLASPSHTYATVGQYTVTLTATNNTSNTCTNTKTMVVTPCLANTTFTLVPTNTPQLWNAIPIITQSILAASWSWGDGSTSNTLFTSHTYSAAGTYSICLSTTAACMYSNTFCASYNIYRSASVVDNSIIKINVIDPALVGLDDLKSMENHFVIFPNPNNGALTLKINQLAGEKARVSIYDLYGRKVFSADPEIINGSLNKVIVLSDVSSGVYFVEVVSDAGTLIEKTIIQK